MPLVVTVASVPSRGGVDYGATSNLNPAGPDAKPKQRRRETNLELRADVAEAPHRRPDFEALRSISGRDIRGTGDDLECGRRQEPTRVFRGRCGANSRRRAAVQHGTRHRFRSRRRNRSA